MAIYKGYGMINDTSTSSSLASKVAALAPRLIANPLCNNIKKDGINTMLASIGQLSGCDCCFIFQFSENTQTIHKTHEWSRVSACCTTPQCPLLLFCRSAWVLEKIKRKETINIHDPLQLPKKIQVLFPSVSYLGAALLIPIIDNNTVVGFVAASILHKQHHWRDQDVFLLKRMVDIMAHKIHADKEFQIKDALINTIRAIASTIDERDQYTSKHQQRVAKLAVALAKKMGLSAGRIEGIELAALIHDIGKIYISTELLNLPRKFTPSEHEQVKPHVQLGYEIIKDVQFPWPVTNMIYQHHEHLDGSGYPKGLTDQNILLESRIITVADVVESMTADRPYRHALTLQEAFEELLAHKGTYYDPVVVDTCIQLFKEEHFSFD